MGVPEPTSERVRLPIAGGGSFRPDGGRVGIEPADVRGRFTTGRRLVFAVLLGVYAAHLMVVEACRTLASQTMQLAWPDSIHDPHACSIGCYLDHHGEHDTPYGLAHRHFHTVITTCESAPEAWEAAAESFRLTLTAAIARQGSATAREHADERLECPA